MKHFLYNLLLITLVITSCKPLSKIKRSDFPLEIITKNNYTKMNGIYSNNFFKTSGKLIHNPYDGFSDYARRTILGQLFWNVPESAWRNQDNSSIDPEKKWIKIEFISKKAAVISMYKNDTFVFSKKIHGKFKNGYFYLRPKVYVLPLIPLVFGYNFERARIGKTSDNLLIDYSVNRWGFAVVSGSSDKGSVSSVYKKKD